MFNKWFNKIQDLCHAFVPTAICRKYSKCKGDAENVQIHGISKVAAHKFSLFVKPSVFSLLWPLKKTLPLAGVTSWHIFNESPGKTQASELQTIAQPPCRHLLTEGMWERRQAGRLHCGDMSAHILQHSVRRTVNISSLQTSNGGGSLGPPVLTTQTGQGTGTGLWCMHELYWGFLLQCRVPIQSSHISLGHTGRG